ncbi:MAG: hypothetical protein L6U16_05750 [Porphyromonadaceae bacterium]|nr:MAG: hypothetical protein L6U16_05750 [Porphyromonadaceae bacterium]
MKQRLVTFDIARAICIILVVIGHFNPDDAPRMVESRQYLYLFIPHALCFSIRKWFHLCFLF